MPKPESHLSKYFGSSAQTSKLQDSQSKTLGSPQKSATGTPGYFSKLFGSNQKLGSDAKSSGFQNTGGPKVHILQLFQGLVPSTLEALKSLNPTFRALEASAAPVHQGQHLQEPRRDHGTTISLNISLITSSRQTPSPPRPQCSRERRWKTSFCSSVDQQANNPPILITVHCPVCHNKVPESTINEHLDSCLS